MRAPKRKPPPAATGGGSQLDRLGQQISGGSDTTRAHRAQAALYDVDVSEAGGGRFRARERRSGVEVVSANAEHDLAHRLTIAGRPDAAVQFWRGSPPSLFHPSIDRMGRYRISLGEDFPKRAKRKDAPSKISSETVEGSPKNRDLFGGGVHAHGDGGRP